MADFPILKWLTIDNKSVPFTYPQHKKGNGYVETGDDNPLPIGNYTQKNGLWVPVSDENPMPTQLTGSNVEYVFFDALALADTNRIQSSIFNISDLSRFYIFVKSTIDVEVKLGIRVTAHENDTIPQAVMYWNGSEYENTYPTSNFGLPIHNTNNAWILLNSRYEWLNKIIAGKIRIQLMALEVPTTGSISVHLVGR